MSNSQIFKIEHEHFCFVTNDKALVIKRILQGYRVAAVDWYMQSMDEGKPVRVIDYGSAGQLLSY